MKKQLAVKEMNIIEAVDNLSGMAELDITTQKEEEWESIKNKLRLLRDLKPEEKQQTLITVKDSFKTVHRYLEKIYEQDKENFQNEGMQKGIRAVMALAVEAIEKISKHTALFEQEYEEGIVSEIVEYKNLQNFYVEKISKRFKEIIPSKEGFEESWEVESPTLEGIEKSGLNDLESVRKDREYELFYIRKDDGHPFFNRNLLRHIKLVTDFDEIVSVTSGDDPLISIHSILDKETHLAAEEIYVTCREYLDDFYLDAMKHKNVPIIIDMNKIVMSLLLAANPLNLLQHTMGKTCTRYYNDFQIHLRSILKSDEYQRITSYPLKEADRLSRALIQLIYAVCFAFFTRSGIKKEMVGYINHLIERGSQEKKSKNLATMPLWDRLLEDYIIIQSLLNQYPSGPLFKTLDIFHKNDEREGFDPIGQKNHPYYLYSVSSKSLQSKCLRVPCPTFHEHVNKAKVINEFKGYLQHLENKASPAKYLLINLQDRTSWEEHARCTALEELQKEADFSQQLFVITFPVKTDFSNQFGVYEGITNADEFARLTLEQIEDGNECGFFFSAEYFKKILVEFSKKILPIIHLHFFDKKEKLSRLERLNFLEVYNLFFFLKILDLVKPDYFSFTCKDAVDFGAAISAGFYSLIKMLSKESKWGQKEYEDLLWLFFAPALIVRERLIDFSELNQTIRALSLLNEVFEKEKKELIMNLAPLYELSFFQQINIIDE